jgi:bifunctional non-homologous end joining protein LigD
MVSTPVEWEEVKGALKKNDPHRLEFDSEAALKRVGAKGDLFAPVLRLKQKVPTGR